SALRLLHHLDAGFLIRFVQMLAQAMLRHLDALVGALLEDLRDQGLIVTLLVNRIGHRIGIGGGLRLAEAELGSDPAGEELVATHLGLEGQLQIMRELVLEGLLAILEAGHAACTPSGRCRLMRSYSASLRTFEPLS